MAENNAKRGWLLDQIMLIGHYEAALTHDDEQICNIYNDLKANSGSLEEVEKLTDELNFRKNLSKIHYESRAIAEQDIFESFRDIDKKKWCDIKHAAATYTLAGEIYHARNYSPSAETNLVQAAKALSYLISYTFGFEPMECLRCFNDAMMAEENEEEGYEVAAEPIAPNPRPEYEQLKLDLK